MKFNNPWENKNLGGRMKLRKNAEYDKILEKNKMREEGELKAIATHKDQNKGCLFSFKETYILLS